LAASDQEGRCEETNVSPKIEFHFNSISKITPSPSRKNHLGEKGKLDMCLDEEHGRAHNY
jgi:hypothetical protein